MSGERLKHRYESLLTRRVSLKGQCQWVINDSTIVAILSLPRAYGPGLAWLIWPISAASAPRCSTGITWIEPGRSPCQNFDGLNRA
jgi:hypothetical protein